MVGPQLRLCKKKYFSIDFHVTASIQEILLHGIQFLFKFLFICHEMKVNAALRVASWNESTTFCHFSGNVTNGVNGKLRL